MEMANLITQLLDLGVDASEESFLTGFGIERLICNEGALSEDKGYYSKNSKGEITSIYISDITNNDFEEILRIPSLVTLSIFSFKEGIEIERVSEIKKLSHLCISNLIKSTNIDFISNLKKLKGLKLDNIKDKNKITLEGLNNLVTLEISNFNYRKIIQNLPQSLESIYLEGVNSASIPKEILETKKLRKLEIHNGEITKIQDSILNLNKLIRLRVSNCKLDTLNNSIFKSKSIVHFDFSENQITAIPKEIGNASKALSLRLDNNSLKTLPEEIQHLKHLNSLGLSNNDLSEIPHYFSKLSDLQDLLIGHNKISSIDNQLDSLEHLRHLDLEHNEIEKLNCDLNSNLNFLDISNNKISSIPENFTKFTNLHIFDIDKNPISEKSLGLLNDLEPDEKISYYLSIQKNVAQPLNEAKILVVGDERAGKTSIIEMLTKGTFNPNQSSTHGIDIQNHLLSNNIKVNIWDFAGQEITHQTHQFFLSTSSLYLYILDAQKEDNDAGIYHWLSTVKSNGGSSPIIIVVNKRDLNSSYHFDLNRYKKDFNIVDVIYTCCDNTTGKTNTNINQLKESIEHNILELEGVKFPLPPQWLKIKNELEDLSLKETDYIESNEYEKICLRHNVGNHGLQKTLLRILNQIGTIVTYKDNNKLNIMQIINPIWVTNGVYKIIRSPLISGDALIDLRILGTIFKGMDNYRDRHYTWLINLLNQFELSFSIDEENKDTVLIPSRLDPNQPKIELSEYHDGLFFKYEYKDILKKSVISQLIVRMKNYITKGETKYWQRGVLLEHGDAKAIIISDEEKRTITIDINKSNRNSKDLLTIIRHTLRLINSNKYVTEEKIPLIFENEIVGYADYYFLIDAEKSGAEKIPLKVNLDNQIKSSSKLFELSDLLDGYRIKENTRFDYTELENDLINFALINTESRHAIYNEIEDLTNDRFKSMLLSKGYRIGDQSRGGESETRKGSGERDIVIRNNQTNIVESIIEAFVLKDLRKKTIDTHTHKITNNYDTTGNKRNFIIIYSKAKNFDSLWEKYLNYIPNLHEDRGEKMNKSKIKLGRESTSQSEIVHIFIDFYAGQ